MVRSTEDEEFLVGLARVFFANRYFGLPDAQAASALLDELERLRILYWGSGIAEAAAFEAACDDLYRAMEEASERSLGDPEVEATFIRDLKSVIEEQRP